MALPDPAWVGGTHVELIVDNLDSGCSIIAGGWDTSDSGDGNGSYGPDFLYHEADQENVGTVRFRPRITTAGSYRVDIYWSADPNRTTAQPVIVKDAKGKTVYHVDLQRHGNQWFTLGHHTFNVAAGGYGGYIDFTSDTEDGYCNADAVRLVSDFTVD